MSPAASPTQLWQTVFDALPEAVCIMDLEGRILNYNRALEVLLGRPAGQLLGLNCCRLLHGAEQPIPGCPFTRLRESRRRETLDLTVDGRTLRVTVAPLFDEAGALIGAVHLLADLTEQARERAGLLDRIRELEAESADRPPREDPRIKVYRRLFADREAENRRNYPRLENRIGKLLAGLKMDLRVLRKKTADPCSSAPLDDCLEDIDRAGTEVRHLIAQIRPPLLDDLGLVPALRWEISRLTERCGITGELEGPPDPTGLSPEMENACFHLVQGALALLVPRARSLTVSVQRTGDRLKLLAGAATPEGTTDFTNQGEIEKDPAWSELQERTLLLGAEASVRSIPGRGLRILFQIPLTARS
jgi:PAS domain S-box-containing protein